MDKLPDESSSRSVVDGELMKSGKASKQKRGAINFITSIAIDSVVAFLSITFNQTKVS